MPSATVRLRTDTESLTFDRRSGRLISLRAHHAPDQELIASSAEHPAFVIQYLDQSGNYRRLTSLDAESMRLTCRRRKGLATLTMTFRKLGERDLNVTMTVRAATGEQGSRWRLTLDNGAGLNVVDIQFPFVVTRYELHGSVLLPAGSGRLIPDPAPENLGPDTAAAWHFAPCNGDSGHYPGGLFAQFIALCANRAGLYMACEDTAANVKLIKALHREPGLRLGLAHVGDWPRHGRRTLEYDVVLRSFTGDWYAAADVYRSWALQQKWAVPLHRRTDVPGWLLDSPAYITLRLQGQLDAGPVFPVKEFLPYEKAVPLLDRLARRLNASLVAVLMSWEHGGPWVYPDCFPPVGGDASLTRFATLARARGWHVGSFCNGTRWVTQHAWNGYDGRDAYRKRRGNRSVCRTPSGDEWTEHWDQSWRPSYAGCLGTAMTRRLAAQFVERLIGWGMESIQFFDQNMGAATFPCFAKDHDHPPMPGKWMAARMQDIIAQFLQAARKADQAHVIHSTEGPCNETCLPLFQECDVRVIPPGHTSNYNFLPLYHYLYHECIVIQGGMGMGPEPYHLPTRNACNGVLGELPGAVMIGDGTLLNKDTGNWAPWAPRVGSDDDAVEMMRTILALRRGPAKDFLALGRMQRPAEVKGIKTVEWERDSSMHRIPAIFHAAWRAPDGRAGVVLANWTDKRRRASVTDKRLGRRPVLHRCGTALTSRPLRLQRAGADIDISVPALGCVLLEAPGPRRGTA